MTRKHLAVRAAVPFLALLAVPLAATAQDVGAPISSPLREALLAAWAAPVPTPRPEPDFGLGVGFTGRFSLPFGSVDRDVAGVVGGGGALIVVDQKLGWNDLFNAGWGAEIEVDVYLGSETGSPHGRGDLRYGGFVSLAVDSFDGDGVGDGFGNTLRVTDLDMSTILVGAKVQMPMGGRTFGDGRIGFGVVHYSTVEGTFQGPGVTAFNEEFFEDTYALAFDVRGRGGISLGPLNLSIGLGFRLLGPPEEGSAVELNSGPLYTFDVDLGLELGF